ncbi:MAG: flagellar protein FlaG [Pseudomonadota bacterium]|jgi:flagellar protein FlaG|uniref:flagellar protein FlaG n=1 Tax=Limnohabitans sp. MORI2 TaxID=1751150 RepID=UPI00237799A1|nr:flagellar protein FlaG [Limnohabitans sp. MORI2]MDE3232226.1 flagellar protein FlaG [Pseudomonadota bacterium]BDU57524.1 flagellar protein FlaG [Limnohabitans sp. MORI2]
MGNEIQPKVPQPALARPEVAVMAMGSKAPVGTTPSEHPKDKEVPSIPKPVIKFDEEHARKNLEEALQKLNDMMKDSGRMLSFTMDVKLGRPIVFVKNMANGEVVRQIPNEVVVRVAHGIEDFKGMLHNAAA